MAAAAAAATKTDAKTSLPSNYYDLTSVVDIDGTAQDLSSLSGCVTVVMNVACECGYTEPGYRAIQSIIQKYAKTHRIVAHCYPCNQFGEQEPGSAKEIKSYVTDTLRISVPETIQLFSKIEVNGPATAAPYQVLKRAVQSYDGAKCDADVSWNFQTKFVVGTNGAVLRRFDFDSDDTQLWADFENYVVSVLPKAAVSTSATTTATATTAAASPAAKK